MLVIRPFREGNPYLENIILLEIIFLDGCLAQFSTEIRGTIPCSTPPFPTPTSLRLIRMVIEDFTFPGITFRPQRFDDGIDSTCFTWEVVIADAPETIKGMSLYELDPETRLIKYVRDVPESAVKPPILGKPALFLLRLCPFSFSFSFFSCSFSLRPSFLDLPQRLFCICRRHG